MWNLHCSVDDAEIFGAIVAIKLYMKKSAAKLRILTEMSDPPCDGLLGIATVSQPSDAINFRNFMNLVNCWGGFNNNWIGYINFIGTFDD